MGKGSSMDGGGQYVTGDWKKAYVGSNGNQWTFSRGGIKSYYDYK